VKKTEVVTYLSRSFRKDLHRKLKSMAPLYGKSLEEMVNLAVELGVEVLERARGVKQRGER
jgi:hypothetical protein